MKTIKLVLVLLLLPASLFAQRLPRLVFPTHYDLTFIPHLDQETFDGKETISVSVQQPTREIVLNSLEIEFKNVELESQSQKHLKAEAQLNAQKEFAILKFSEPILP